MNVLDEVRYLKPLQAVRSVRALIANPENTGEVFKIIEALKGGSLARAVARMQADPRGSALLHSKPAILPFLSDREALRVLPAVFLVRMFVVFV
jgi:ubiquinone biosynthesis protein COQ4